MSKTIPNWKYPTTDTDDTISIDEINAPILIIDRLSVEEIRRRYFPTLKESPDDTVLIIQLSSTGNSLRIVYANSITKEVLLQELVRFNWLEPAIMNQLRNNSVHAIVVEKGSDDHNA